MFSCEFCEISKNTFFTEYVLAIASFFWLENATVCLNELFKKENYKRNMKNENNLQIILTWWLGMIVTKFRF